MTRQAQKNEQSASSSPSTPQDPAAFAAALMRVYERAQPVLAEMLEKYSAELPHRNPDPFNIGGAWAAFMDSALKNPEKLQEAQSAWWTQWMTLWQESAKKFMGEESHDVIEPDKADRRFRAPEWQENALFDFLKQSYLMTAQWMDKTIRETQDLAPEKKEKLAFYTRLFADALSPSNFLWTNPEVIRETLNTGGENLIRGLENLIEDLQRGQISTTDYNAFEVGRNIATTPGKVVFQNELMQLIQYVPATEKVFKTPLLIVPPWINKYYILDLRPDNSFIKWAVDQGHTVFIISWVNPTPRLAQKRFEDYMNEGVLAALGAIEEKTGEASTNVIGYCLGGTLLAITLSYLKAKKQEGRIASATFLTTLLDFENAGEMKLFLDDGQLELLDRDMAEKGVFEGRELHRTFSLLRANDMIWSFVVNNYLMGKEPFPFDLLYWNDDSTNMPAAMHSFYLRKMYRDNCLTKPGSITMNNVKIDLGTVNVPAYFLSAKEDHIAPWKATYAGARLLGKPAVFTLSASGHVAGVINAPGKNKYCYWTSEDKETLPEKWLESAKENPGSWWPHWQSWIKGHAGAKIPARKIGKAIEDAPGSYVKGKS